MSNPSDPQRHHGADLPRDTDAFEDTEFSMGDRTGAAETSVGGSGAPRGAEGYDAEVASTGDGQETNREVIDAESTEVTDGADGTEGTAAAPLGSARDPEVTGIIPIVDDERIAEHEQKLNDTTATTVLPTAAATGAAGAGAGATAAASDGTAAAGTGSSDADDATGAGSSDDGSGSDGPQPGDGSRPWYAQFPTWGWILVIGVGLSVVGAATAVALMTSGDEDERHSPYSSVVPEYPRPKAWDSKNPIEPAQPDNSAGYYYEPQPEEPEEYAPSTAEETEDAAPSSRAPSPSEPNPGNGGGNGGNGNGGGNTGGGTGGGQTTPGNPGDGNGGGGTGGGTGGGGTGGDTGGGTDDDTGTGGDTGGTGTGDTDGATGD
ncbi:hypothetical protein [Corynebacterium kalidii]